MPNYLSPGVYVEEVPPLARPIAGVSTSTPGFIGVIPDTVQIPAPIPSGAAADDVTRGFKWVDVNLPTAAEVHFITTWSQYTSLFGDFVGVSGSLATTQTSPVPAVDPGQNRLAQAVYGFFNNGGTSCYVTRVVHEADLSDALNAFTRIDDISIVAAPGLVTGAEYELLMTHCETMLDRVAILDPVQIDTQTPSAFGTGDFTSLETPPTATPPGLRPRDSHYAAFYFPWIQVQDPTGAFINAYQKSATPSLPPVNIYVPPSGHIAGIYARSDNARGVFKAPANEQVNGALGLRWALGKGDQDGLNPPGVNLIRSLNGGILVWGARTVGGDDNGDYKYISTRRYFNYLRKSIEQGTQFVVFEPNTPALWQRILRTVGDFLQNEWRSGALFGNTAAQAFFVLCDQNTNTPDTIALGQVVTEIGVAIVQPAEFVIFRIQQQTAS